MIKRKKKTAKPKEEYDFLHLEVLNYSISTDAAINHEVRDKRHHYDEAKVYSFYSDASIDCRLLWPEDRPDWDYHIHIIGDPMGYRDFDMTLEDCHVKDDRGQPIYRKRGGKRIPEYNVPNGLGFWEKVRGQDRMSGTIWVSPEILSDMMNLLVNVAPIYVHIHELKVGRTRWICGFTLQTEKPE